MDAFCGVKTDALGRLKTAAQRLAFLHSIPTSKSEIQDQRRLTGFFLLTLKVRFKEGFCILFLRPRTFRNCLVFNTLSSKVK